MSKIRVALIIPGGLGTGKNNMGIPVLEQIVNQLSLSIDLTVFQLFPVNPDYNAKGYKLISIYSKSRIIRLFRLLYVFHRNHRINKFSVVHGFWTLPSGLFAVWLGRLYRIKSISSVLGGDVLFIPEINYGQLKNQLNIFLVQWSLKQADEVIVLTNYLKQKLDDLGIKRNDVKIIPWGVDTNLFKFKKCEKYDILQFLHIANLHPIKDQITLLKCFRIVSDNVKAHLTIIGEGILEIEIRNLITQLNLESNVTMLKPMPNNLLPRYYAQAHILLHTSLSEGQSEVVTEAMSSGVLVAGTEVGLIFDLPEFTVSAPVRDYTLLAQKILSILKQPEEMNLKINKAHEWSLNHNIDYTVQKLLTMYQ